MTAVIAAAVLVWVSTLVVPWSLSGRLDPVPATDVLSAAAIERAESYSAVNRKIALAAYFLSIIVTGIFGFTRIGSRLIGKCCSSFRWWWAVPTASALLLLVVRGVTLPLSVMGHRLRLQYGLTLQTWGSWTIDYVKAAGVDVVLTAIVMLVLVGFARYSPRWWFAWAGATVGSLVFVGSFLYPVVIEPIFNEFEPLAPGAFRSSVLDLAKDQGVKIDDVLVTDASRRTTTLNAYVSGFAGTRRVVVYDNLLEDLGPDEARVVIAHELAHAKYSDVLMGTTGGALSAVGGVAVLALVMDSSRVRRWTRTKAGEPTAVALLLALVSVGSLLASPTQNAASRAVEARADRSSIAATNDPATFVEMQRQLAIHAASDPTPPRLYYLWFSSHPTLLERVAMAKSMEERSR